MTTHGSAQSAQDNNIIETIQSLIVAFVLAMTFRGFVTEGFVIPTGSMAPTLLGQHALIHSQQTGFEFAVGLDQAQPSDRIADPMLGDRFPGSGVPKVTRPNGMGDRILVLKWLYPFTEPKRFDVVVFKNPTDPLGEAANYIKRLIGLPNEKIWLADGDVFARPWQGETDDGDDSDDYSDFRVQRKPEHVQRAVWQPVYNSDFAPQHLDRLALTHRYEGPPWVGDESQWDLTADGGRTYVLSTADPAMLVWDLSRRGISDWTPYNMLARRATHLYAVNDVRVSAGVIRSQAQLKMTLELEARSHLFQFIIDENSTGVATVTLRMRPLSESDGDGQWVEQTGNIMLPAPGRVFNVEFWHADQAMRIFVDGKSACEPLEYEWSPLERLQFATGKLNETNVDVLVNALPQPARIRWRFERSPVTLHRVRVDRDLHYRHEMLPGPTDQRNRPYLSGHAFGTHPTSPSAKPGVLGPDQFMMCGDNSQMSLDSRLWGSPHPLIAAQIDESPFTVHRKLLIGKAWVVYFPAPYPIRDGGNSVIPDFGRLRFIR